MNYKILIWGTGERTKNYIKQGYFDSCDIKGFIETISTSENFMGKKLYSPDEIVNLIDYVDYIVICNQFFSEILDKCLSIGISREKLIFTDGLDDPFFLQDIKIIETISPKLREDILFRRFSLISMNEKDYWDERMELGKGFFSHPQYRKDYFRFRTFEFVAEEIINNNIPGELAEFGVFRGTFSALINKKMPEKRLFLFDTFEGFDETELKKEIGLGRTDENFGNYYAETSIDRVNDVLPFHEKAVFCQGFFPESIIKEAEHTKYCFVSIDVDFEDSIYEGIKFFYPRLSEGGYIFVHDYNSLYLKGVREAIRRYEKDKNIRLIKVPLADKSGTLIITK